MSSISRTASATGNGPFVLPLKAQPTVVLQIQSPHSSAAATQPRSHPAPHPAPVATYDPDDDVNRHRHYGRPLRPVIQNPMRLSRTYDRRMQETIEFRCSDGATAGVALSDAECAPDDGVKNGRKAVYDSVANEFKGLRELSIVISWPGFEHARWTKTLTLVESSHTKTTYSQMLLAISREFRFLFQKLEATAIGLPLSGSWIKYSQLRILSVFTVDGGKSWAPELVYVDEN